MNPPIQYDDDPPQRRQRAVALHWREGEDEAPRVVAKGEGALAEEILRIAFERGIKVRTDADLTDILAAVEIDQQIPYTAFAAVAEILAYIYAANAAASPSRSGHCEGRTTE